MSIVSLQALPEKSVRPAVEALRLASDVLSYWGALLRQEEALAARPKARRPSGGSLTTANPKLPSTVQDAASGGEPGSPDEAVQPNLEAPVAGQNYAKLAFSGMESFLIDRKGEVEVALSGEWTAYFEDWLLARYRRGGEGDADTAHLVLFPAIHLPNGELASVLRAPLEIQWRAGETPFRVPEYLARKQRRFPLPPDRALLKQSAKEAEEALPFFVDIRVLRDTLRVDGEMLDDFFNELRGRGEVSPRETVESVISLLQAQITLEGNADSNGAASGTWKIKREPTEAGAEGTRRVAAVGNEEVGKVSRALLGQLCAVIKLRLGQLNSRVRVYGLALVIGRDQSRATWHLQRDLERALVVIQERKVQEKSAVFSYLTGQALPTGTEVCWGRWRGAGLTESQRATAEFAIGSTLAAAQGPPGTGKTTLILNLLSDQVVRKVTGLSSHGRMGSAITVVASTNNRAVDNVVDPLGRDWAPERLVLSLRVGNRQVLDTVTVAELERSIGWLRAVQGDPEVLQARLRDELAGFTKLRAEVDAVYAPGRSYQAKLLRQRQIEAELNAQSRCQPRARSGDKLRNVLTRLTSSAATQAGDEKLNRLIGAFGNDGSLHGQVKTLIKPVMKRLSELSALAEGVGRKRLEEIGGHWRNTQKRQLAKLEQSLGFPILHQRFAHCKTDAAAPSDVELALETWEEMAEEALLDLEELSACMRGKKGQNQTVQRSEALERELAEIRSATVVPPPELDGDARAAVDALHLELFERALRAREAWARVNREALTKALERAIQSIRDARGLRGLMEADGAVGGWLRELFPAWGCTLLSLGNVFPSEPGSIDTAIIDEAGQCHPAYAIAALLRGQSSLIIGDVHQLEPVIGLSVDEERRILRGIELRGSAQDLDPYRVFDGSGVSAQRLADRAVPGRPTLVDHFRCQPAIAAISEALCHYGLVVRTPLSSRSDLVPWLTSAVLHVSVDGQQQRFAGSLVNEAELRVVLDLVQALLRAGISPGEIGLITPYRGQLEQLWRSLRAVRAPLERPRGEMGETAELQMSGLGNSGLAAGTVHRFQGGERSIIVFSTTVTLRRSLSFVDRSVNLVNVAASRAKHHLITIGHTPTLQSGSHSRFLVDWAEPLRYQR